MNFTEPLREHARREPDGVAVILASGQAVDYATLDATVDAVGRRLIAAGVQPGDVVALSARRHWRTILLTLALGRIGASAAPRGHPTELARAAIEFDANASPPSLPLIPTGRDWYQPVRRAGDLGPLAPHGGSNTIAVHFPSSGTTGAAKSIMVTHDALAHRVASTRQGIPLPPRARTMCIASPGSGYGFLCVLRTLWDGGTLVLSNGPADASAQLAAHRVEHLTGMPYWLDAIATAMSPGASRTPALQSVAFAGGAMPEAMADRIRERLCERIECVYGATEIGCAATGDMRELRSVEGAVGRAVAGVRVDAVDDLGNALPAGASGRLRLSGPGVAQGYAGIASDAFKGDAFTTTDLGSVGEDGIVRLEGRTSDAIDIAGVRVMPGPIEEALFAVPGVRDAAVVGRTGPTGSPQVWAAIVAAREISLDAIERSLAARRVRARPSVVARVPRIPRNDAGKVDRNALEALLSAGTHRRS